MNKAKNYFTVAELQEIWEALGLLTDGFKPELMERILNFVSMKASTDLTISQPADVSRISVFRSRVLSNQTSDKSIQVEPISDTGTQSKSWKFVLSLFVTIVGFVGGCLAIAQFLFVDDKIEIPIRRSWFW